MLDDETTDYLEQRLNDVDTLNELQAYVAATSSLMQEPPSEPIDTVGEERVMGGMERWLSSLRAKLETLAAEEGADDYGLGISAGTTGLSITISVTYQTDSPEAE